MGNSKKEIKWRKVGGGSLRYIRGHIIKPNEVFIAYENEIPLAFRGFVVPLEDLPKTEGDKVLLEKRGGQAKYELHSVGNGWWDIINVASGKAINEKQLRKNDAEKVLKELL